jgi:hypothetical protein
MGGFKGKTVYVSPTIEMIEFQFEESIATSGGESKGAAFFDELWD